MRNFPNYSIKRPARLVKPRESGTSVSLFGSLPRLHRSRVCLHPLPPPTPRPPLLASAAFDRLRKTQDWIVVGGMGNQKNVQLTCLRRRSVASRLLGFLLNLFFAIRLTALLGADLMCGNLWLSL